MRRNAAISIKTAGLLLTLIAVLLMAASTAEAHTNNSEGYSTIEVQDGSIRYTLRLDAEELGHSIGIQPGELVSNEPAVSSYIHSRLLVYADGIPAEGVVEQMSESTVEDRPYIDILITYAVGGTPENVIVRYNLIFDDSDPSHANMATMQLNGEQQEFIFTYEVRELNLGETSFFTKAKQFFVLGVEHLFTGYDHILFVISLLLGAATIRHIVSLVTAFTIAHSATLILASLQVVQLPGKLVESAIALSIVYVALRNIFQPGTKHSPWIALAFGLIHGFGFAGVLSELHLGGGHLVASLLFFNLGIEAGQLLIVFLVFPLLLLLRKRRQAFVYKWLAPSVSAVVLLMGCIWFVQRSFMG